MTSPELFLVCHSYEGLGSVVVALYFVSIFASLLNREGRVPKLPSWGSNFDVA
jgi:hypothetical protein